MAPGIEKSAKGIRDISLYPFLQGTIWLLLLTFRAWEIHILFIFIMNEHLYKESEFPENGVFNTKRLKTAMHITSW